MVCCHLNVYLLVVFVVLLVGGAVAVPVDHRVLAPAFRHGHGHRWDRFYDLSISLQIINTITMLHLVTQVLVAIYSPHALNAENCVTSNQCIIITIINLLLFTS